MKIGESTWKVEEGDPFVDLFREMVVLWGSAPTPRTVPFGDGGRLKSTTAATTAVAWGWLVRVIRTGESAILLARNGLGPESAPLMRSVIEHSVRSLTQELSQTPG